MKAVAGQNHPANKRPPQPKHSEAIPALIIQLSIGWRFGFLVRGALVFGICSIVYTSTESNRLIRALQSCSMSDTEMIKVCFQVFGWSTTPLLIGSADANASPSRMQRIPTSRPWRKLFFPAARPTGENWQDGQRPTPFHSLPQPTYVTSDLASYHFFLKFW